MYFLKAWTLRQHQELNLNFYLSHVVCRTYKPVMVCHYITVAEGWRPRCTALMWQYMALENGDVKNDQAPVVQTLDSTIHQINYYLVDKAIDFPNTYAMDRFMWWVVLFNVWTTRARMLWWITPHDRGRCSDNVEIFPQPNSCYNSVFSHHLFSPNF